MLDQQIASNKRRAVFLLVATMLLLGSVLFAAWYALTLDSALLLPLGLFTLISPWAAYYGSDKIVILASGAVDADTGEYAQLHNVVEEMALAAGLPKPRVMIVVDPAPNAFATGRDPEHAVVAATTGLLERMDREQLQAVIAHELAHVANRDILVGTIAASLTGLIMLVSHFALRMLAGGSGRGKKVNPVGLAIGLVGLVLAPIGAALLRAAVSRRREALADASSAALTRNPTGMRRALEALDADSTEIRKVSHATSALWIEEPNPTQKGAVRWLTKMYATHPPMADRIQAMRQLEAGA